jgi:hypothetical protein
MFPYSFLPQSDIDNVPWILRSEQEFDIGIDGLWNIITDDRAWEHWHPEVTKIKNKTEPAGGAGNSRTIVFRQWLLMILLAGPLTIAEDYDVWEDKEPNMKRYQFWLTAASRPKFLSFNRAREEFKVEAISENRCKFTRTVALDPGLLSRYGLGFIVLPMLRHLILVKTPQRLAKAIENKILPIKA